MEYNGFHIEQIGEWVYDVWETRGDWLRGDKVVYHGISEVDVKQWVDRKMGSGISKAVEAETSYFILRWSGSISWSGKTFEEAVEDFKSNQSFAQFMKDFSHFENASNLP